MNNYVESQYELLVKIKDRLKKLHSLQCFKAKQIREMTKALAQLTRKIEFKEISDNRDVYVLKRESNRAFYIRTTLGKTVRDMNKRRTQMKALEIRAGEVRGAIQYIKVLEGRNAK